MSGTHPATGREHLDTERANPRTIGLGRATIEEALELFDHEDRGLAEAVDAVRGELARAIELVVASLRAGGRLVYVGAGTSGRLAVLDAAECPPTFGIDPERIQARIAGGHVALVRSVEGAEDDEEAGRAAAADATERDTFFGIAAGGTTPFVHAALAEARAHGASTVFLACVPAEQVSDRADVSIRLATGPEVLAGSTRLKAGTATKMVLNRVTTIAMARIGKVFGNRMVDLDARANAKLIERATAMIQTIAGTDRTRATDLLEAADGKVKVACVMARFGCDAAEARGRLDRAEDRLDQALEPEP
ncbi:MAG TPA: N-acetylmuramic acid 6-phosphate etherase [Planctomycetes bacterium]|nr:N-acetylmuramic acid 6-phosphate etherase [Planctomycetota bacterium]